jgi:hypothetical protein
MVGLNDIPSQPGSWRGLPSALRAWRHPVVERRHLPRPVHGSCTTKGFNKSVTVGVCNETHLKPVEEAVAPSDLASGAYPRVMAGCASRTRVGMSFKTILHGCSHLDAGLLTTIDADRREETWARATVRRANMVLCDWLSYGERGKWNGVKGGCMTTAYMARCAPAS